MGVFCLTIDKTSAKRLTAVLAAVNLFAIKSFFISTIIKIIGSSDYRVENGYFSYLDILGNKLKSEYQDYL